MCTFIFYDDMAGRCSQWFLGFTGGKLTHIYWTRFSGCCCDAGGTDRRFGHFTWALYVLQDRIRVWLLCAVFSKAVDFFFHYLRSFVHRWIKNGSKHSQQACLTISFFLSFNFLILFSCLISASWLITPAHIMITRSHTHILHKHTHTQSSLGSRCG